MKKKILILVLGIFTALTLFAKDNSVEKIKEKGYFTVGLDATFAPMGFRDEKGELVGIDIDLAKEVAKRMGVDVKFLPCEWDGIIFDLKSKKIDLVWNGMTITPAREKQVNFTKPYMSNNQVLFTKKEMGKITIPDLKGKRVGVQLGSSGDYALEKNSIRKELKELKKYATNVEALLDLEAGRLDVVVTDEISGKYYNDKQNTLVFSEENVYTSGFGVASRKEDKELSNMIDEYLEDMKKDGTFDKIVKKWIK